MSVEGLFLIASFCSFSANFLLYYSTIELDLALGLGLRLAAPHNSVC